MTSKNNSIELSNGDGEQPDPVKPTNSSRSLPNKNRFTKFKDKNIRGPRGKIPSKGGSTAYEKKDIPSSLRIPARKRHFPVYVSNLGIPELASVLFRCIRQKDYRLAANITEQQLCYVMALSWYNRLVQTSADLGYCIGVEEASRLKQAAKGIQLPEVAAQYIEALGEYLTSSGVNVVPLCFRDFALFCPDREEQPETEAESEVMDEDPRPTKRPRVEEPAQPVPPRFWYYDHRDALRNAGRPVPNNHWAIDYDWIEAWNGASTRGTFRGISFRRVDLSSLTGKEVLIVSRKPGSEAESFQPCAPQSVGTATGDVGVTYGFRHYDDVDQWPGENKQLVFDAFVGPESCVTTTFNDLVVDSFTQRGLDASV